jgi:hypothetical protein
MLKDAVIYFKALLWVSSGKERNEKQPSPAISRTGYTSKEPQILADVVLSFLVSDLK